MGPSLLTTLTPKAAAPRLKVHFDRIDELRFVAAFAVIVHHLELFKNYAGYPSVWPNFFICHLGEQGVRLFFVLSGFLISYLLIVEQKKNGKVDAIKFYLRRICRIWPLYFLIVGIAFFVIPLMASLNILPENLRVPADNIHQNYFEKLALFVFFLPNLAKQLYTGVLGAAQCWSLGVEEQYYVFAPLLLNLFKRVPIVALLSMAAVKYLAIAGLLELGHHYPWTPTFTLIHNFLESLDFEAFAAGGFAAYLLSLSSAQVRGIYAHPAVGVIGAALALISCTWEFHYRPWVTIISFASVVLFLAAQNKPAISKTSKAFQHLGKISYGLYMYHLLCIYVLSMVLSSVNPLKLVGEPLFNVLFYAVSIGSTIVVSNLSYECIEKPFLKLKDKFSYIDSN